MVAMHIAYGLDLIALSAGTALLVWSMKNPGKGSWLGKLVGLIVLVLSVISIFCMLSCTLKGSECHGPGRGEGMMMAPPPAEAGPGHEHEHAAKKEHKHT